MTEPTPRLPAQRVASLGLALALLLLLLAGCTAPIGADRVTLQQAYKQVESGALRTGKPSASTVSILHHHELDRVAVHQADEAVHQLHQKALATGRRDLLYALAELSYVAGEQIRSSVKPWDTRDARDYYLGSAVYAWLYLFGPGEDAPPSPFDRRFREACDFYNYSLGLALTRPRDSDGIVHLESAQRPLPVGGIELNLGPTKAVAQFNQAERILLADQFRVRGLSVRNREAGVGAPLIGVLPADPSWGMNRAIPATVLLRLQGSLEDVGNHKASATLEIYSPLQAATVTIGQTQVPLESDLTTYRAYTLSQARMWQLGRLDFLAPSEHMKSQLILNQPYEPDRIPVVFVHGTFSSPVTWAEMANTLTSDPVLRQRYQIWSFIYGSGNPLAQSIADLRAALTAEIQRRDPEGTNAALQQMVVIGHSQGGLLTKGTIISTGDRMWRAFSTNRLEDVKSDVQREQIRRLMFYEPLPFVQRVVFIATPHRGSYLSGSFVRRLARRVVSLPSALVSHGTEIMSLSGGTESERFFRGKVPTSLDGMSPKNPGLRIMTECPIDPSVKVHSIIPVAGSGDYRQGRDGIVSYESAHVENVESELIVRSRHTCLNRPATIEEVRRILLKHLEPAESKAAREAAASRP